MQDDPPENPDMPFARARVASMADWATSNSPEFWVGHLIGAYELNEGRDHDPDGEPNEIYGLTMKSSNAAFVFFETSRDYVAYHAPDPGPQHVVDLATFNERTSLHETGHFFNLRDYYLPSDPRGIMNYFDASFGANEVASFNNNDLGQIQSKDMPRFTL